MSHACLPAWGSFVLKYSRTHGGGGPKSVVGFWKLGMVSLRDSLSISAHSKRESELASFGQQKLYHSS